MISASEPGRPERILAVDASGALSVRPGRDFARFFVPGDVLVVNDAATLPASLRGTHVRSGAEVEVRLVSRGSLAPDDVLRWDAVVFGEGDYRTLTEHRSPPPALLPGDVIELGGVRLSIESLLGHPRLVRAVFQAAPSAVWELLSRHGHPIQYAHVPQPLRLWDVWTRFAGPPVALEPPSAGFVLDWSIANELEKRGVEVVSLTHAAGISSTGDDALDARLPLPEPYRIPGTTALAVLRARRRGARVIALGTTVARALESAARVGGGTVRAGKGVATLRLGETTPLLVTDVLVTGVHERGTSHHALMHAFTSADVIEAATARMEEERFLHHEFGDLVWLERAPAGLARAQPQLAAGLGRA